MLNVVLPKKFVLFIHNADRDFEVMNHYIEKCFSNSVLLVHTESASNALKKAKLQKFDYIISSDDSLENGPITFIRELIENPINAKTPFLLIQDKKSSDEFFAKTNNITFLTKPINYNKLMELLALHLNLNSSDQFKSAKCFESLVHSSAEFIGKLLNTESSVSDPQFKATSDTFLGSNSILLSIEAYGYHSSYIISVEEELLKNLTALIKNKQKLPFKKETLSKAIANILFKSLQNNNLNKNINIKSNKLIHLNSKSYKFLSDQVGVYLTVESKFGNLLIYSI